MKIIVEEGDDCTHLEPGTYEFHPQRTSMRYDHDYNTIDGRRFGPARLELQFEGQLGRKLCGLCGEATCAQECPDRILDGKKMDIGPPINLAKFAKGECEQCGNTHGDACAGGQFVNVAPNFGGFPQDAGKAMADVIQRNKAAVREALGLSPVRACDECGGTGQWENPANGRRSPCSRGCKP